VVPAVGRGVVRAGRGYRLYMAGLLFLVYVVHHLDRNVLLLLQEPIRKEFGLSDSQLGMLSGIGYALPFAMAGIPLGALADRVNRTRLVALLLVIWSGFTAVSGLARSLLGLIAARAAIGAAESGAPPAIMSIFADSFPTRSRPAAMSFFFMGPFVGLLIGLTLGGVAAARFGWRGAFFIASIPGLLIAVLILTTLREPERGASDLLEASDAAPRVREVIRFAVGDAGVRRTILAMVAASVVSIGVASWISVLLVRVYGLPLAQAGLITGLVAGVPGALGSIAAGWTCTRFGGRNDQLMRLCGTAVGVAAPVGFLAAWLNDLPLTVLGFALWGFVNTMFIGPGHSAYLNVAAPRIRATLSATVVVACNLVGAGLGPQLIGWTSDLLHRTADPRALPHAIAALALAGFLPSFLFLRARQASLRDQRTSATTGNRSK
jgi:predicted MFS family arabinose efflux permease